MERPNRGRRDGAAGRQEAHDRRLGEPAQRDPRQPPVALDRLQHGAQRVRGAHLGVAVGEQDQQPGLGRGLHDVPEQRERRAVGGVDVLERDHELVIAGRCPDERGDGVEHPQPLLLAVGRLGAVVGDGGRRAAVAGEPAEVVEHPDGEAARGRHERAQRRPPGTVRARLLAGAATHDRGAAGAGLGGRLVDDPRLADTRLARDRHDLRRPGARGLECAAKARQLALAADEGLAVLGDGHDRHARRAAQPVERVADRGRVRRTVGRALGEQGENERVQRGRDARRALRRRLGLGAPVGLQQRGDVGPENGGRPHRSSHSVAPSE